MKLGNTNLNSAFTFVPSAFCCTGASETCHRPPLLRIACLGGSEGSAARRHAQTVVSGASWAIIGRVRRFQCGQRLEILCKSMQLGQNRRCDVAHHGPHRGHLRVFRGWYWDEARIFGVRAFRLRDSVWRSIEDEAHMVKRIRVLGDLSGRVLRHQRHAPLTKNLSSSYCLWSMVGSFASK